MPELPEVETTRLKLRPHLAGRRIEDFFSTWPRRVFPSRAAVRRTLAGSRVAGVDRHGKRLLLELDSGQVVGLGLGMTGNLEWADGLPPDRRHLRHRFRLDRGWLLFFDARKFGRVMLFADAAAARAGLGPDALDRRLRPGRFRARLASRRAIKTVLLDQKVIAGVGNIYSDEALFRAGIRPATPAARIGPVRAGRLLDALRRVLRESIRRQGTSFDWAWPGGRMQYHLMVYGRAGEPCRRCGAGIRSLRLGGRSSCYCPRCQR